MYRIKAPRKRGALRAGLRPVLARHNAKRHAVFCLYADAYHAVPLYV